MDEVAISVGPNHWRLVEETKLNTIAILTKLGAKYIIPDVSPAMFRELMNQIDLRMDSIVIRNMSDSMLILPFRIIESVVRVVRDINMSYGVLWRAPDGG